MLPNSALAAKPCSSFKGPAKKHLNNVDEKLQACFLVFSHSRKKLRLLKMLAFWAVLPGQTLFEAGGPATERGLECCLLQLVWWQGPWNTVDLWLWMRLWPVPQPQGWNGRKLRNGLHLAGKATALVLLRLLGKLKTHVVRKREIYSKERFKDKENFKWFTVLKMYAD